MADAFDPAHAAKLEAPERLEALPQAAVVGLLDLDGAETVVDYGAGTGVYTLAVLAAVPRGRVIAVEALAPLAERLRERAAEVPGALERLEIVQTADNAVPAADGAADRVFMVDVLHHLHDQPDALSEITRLLRPGGLLAIADWGDKWRPTGPPLDHVLGLDAVRAIVRGMGLDEVEAHDQGDGLPYHLTMVARKP